MQARAARLPNFRREYQMKLNRRDVLGLLGASAAAIALPDSARSQAARNELEAHLENALSAGHAPGLVGLVAQGDQVQVMVLGQMAVDGPPMQRHSIFRLASMSKPVTAAATMLLIADGKLKLDEPVDRLLPELANRQVLRILDGPVDDTIPAERAITVEDLLTFRLGWGLILEPPGTYPIQKKISELGIVGFGPPDPNMPFDGEEWIRRLGTLPLFAQPGQRWMYTTGSNILGVLIARASGQSFGDFLAERIFSPLGMKDTGFYVPSDKIDRLVTAQRRELHQKADADIARPVIVPGMAAAGALGRWTQHCALAERPQLIRHRRAEIRHLRIGQPQDGIGQLVADFGRFDRLHGHDEITAPEAIAQQCGELFAARVLTHLVPEHCDC
jgi:CubicO group peptidase (beta-lactamase class C family)